MSGEDALVYWSIWAAAVVLVTWITAKLDTWFPLEKDDWE